MNIFEFTNYKKFVTSWVESQPNRGYGLYTKMAEAIGLSSGTINQILKGEKNLSGEHAYNLAEFLSLTQSEKEYFLLLLNFEKAGSHTLRELYRKQIYRIQKDKLHSVKEVVEQDIVLSESDKAIFYSNWQYSAIRLLSSIKKYKTSQEISARLQISREQVEDILNYLVKKGLCEFRGGQYSLGARRTHLEAGSPYIKTRQVAWRVKGFEAMDEKKEKNLFYTAPMAISKRQYEALRKLLTGVIADYTKNYLTDEPDLVACLNVDLFEF